MYVELLQRFLGVPLSDGGEIFRMFAQLPGAVAAQGKRPLERYVYVPGTRADRVLLVAHADTVWDKAYGKPAQTTVQFENGVFSGTNEQCGIGADDRAGCAMLWALRDSGHSLLVVDGEESGKRGAAFLRRSNLPLYRQLNKHRFMIELDWQGTGTCLYNQVDNTAQFKEYIAKTLGAKEDDFNGGCDLQVLCDAVCGVNLGVGYHQFHRPGETLCLNEWEQTLKQLQKFLQQEHPRFCIPIRKRMARYLRMFRTKAKLILRKLCGRARK